MKYLLSTVQGDTIYQLSSITRLKADDTFIVNRSSDGEHLDYKITYEQLSSRILNDLCIDYHLSSMAFKDWWEYAKVIHDHDYDHVKFEPAATTGTYKIGTVVIDGRQIDWYIPQLRNVTYEKNVPVIGELKFIYGVHQSGSNYIFGGKQVTPIVCTCSGGTTCNVFKDEYGRCWVQPKGQTINTTSRYKFQEACKVFGNNGKTGNDSSFTLPDFRNFLKMNPGITRGTQSTMQNPCQVGLPEHNHLFSYNVYENKIPDVLNVDAKIEAYTVANNAVAGGNQPHRGSHAAKKDDRTHTYEDKNTTPPSKFTIPISHQFNSSTIGSYGQPGEVYPSYIELPIFMYIGNI